MTTRLKTVEYYFPILTTATDAADTNFTQITVDLPESTKTFKSVILSVQAHSPETTLGNITRRQLSMSVAGSAYTVVNNTNTITNSGEQYCFLASGDFTSLFTASYSSTSHTVDARVLFDSSSASSLGHKNITARLTITYTFDDTSSTQVKTVYFPLASIAGAAPSSKSAGNAGTIPALNTWCPETSKTFKNITLVVQGNTNVNAGTTDATLSLDVGDQADYTSVAYENSQATDMWYRITYNCTAMATSSTQAVSIWGSVADFNHPQMFVVITYTYDAASTTIMNSLLLPISSDSVFGTSSGTHDRHSTELWIEEPTTITVSDCGLMLFWFSTGNIAGLNMRIGTGSFVAYTDEVGVLGGANGAGLAAPGGSITLARGKNTFSFDTYRGDATDLGFGPGGYWIINYTSGNAGNGGGAHNKTIWHGVTSSHTAAATVEIVETYTTYVPESDVFFNSLGNYIEYITTNTTNGGPIALDIEILGGESSAKWKEAYSSIGISDPEVGVFTYVHAYTDSVRQWTSDIGSVIVPTTSRTYKFVHSPGGSQANWNIYALYTYHSITTAISGTVTGYTGDGSGITVNLIRSSDGRRLKSFTTTAGGGWSGTWYDNTDNIYTEAVQSTKAGRSVAGTA